MSIPRRSFLKTVSKTALMWSGFTIAPSRILGAAAPSRRIAMGMIGVGGMGLGNMRAFLELSDEVVVRAVCDVNTDKTDQAKAVVDKRYGNKDCLVFRDFRELCDREDIDAVMIATPDHWHACIGTYAARRGKDIYGEKPFTHDLREGRGLVRAVQQHGCVWQTGSWQRSSGSFRRAAELVRNGRIGKLLRVEVGLPGKRVQRAKPSPVAIPPPATLDWDLWLGPAPAQPFRGVYDWDWRWVMDWGGGQMMDWIGHHGDIAHWGMDAEQSGPVEVEGTAQFSRDAIYDSPEKYNFVCTYKQGVKMMVADHEQVPMGAGTRWIGENGWVWVMRGDFKASAAWLLEEPVGAGEQRLYASANHHRNFVDCVRTRRETITPAETAHRSASIGHLGMIAMLTGRKIRWNPETEEMVNDPGAAALLGRTPRSPWLWT